MCSGCHQNVGLCAVCSGGVRVARTSAKIHRHGPKKLLHFVGKGDLGARRNLEEMTFPDRKYRRLAFARTHNRALCEGCFSLACAVKGLPHWLTCINSTQVNSIEFNATQLNCLGEEISSRVDLPRCYSKKLAS